MGYEDGSASARMELCTRIDTLARGLSRLSATALTQELEHIRRTAMQGGLVPVVTVVHAIDRALARGERGPMVLSWLDGLREMCGCEALDQQASDSFAASISVRLG